MAWEDTMIPMVRHLINDASSTPTYSNTRLEQTIVVAAQLVNLDVVFDQTYTVNVVSVDITPDPTDLPDNAFINLTVLKAACIILGSEARTYALSGVKVTDGPSTIDMTNVYKSIIGLYKKLCDDYDKAIMGYVLGDGRSGAAVTGPMVNEGIGQTYGNFN